MDNEKLGFFDRRKLRKFLSAPYLFEDYKKLPINLQQNPLVLRRVILEETKRIDSTKAGDFLLEVFKNKKELFLEDSTFKMIDYIMKHKKYEYLEYLNIEEYSYLASKYLEGMTRLELDVRKHINEEVAKAIAPLNKPTTFDFTTDEKIEKFLSGELTIYSLDNKTLIELAKRHPEHIELFKESRSSFTAYVKVYPDYLQEHPEDFILCDDVYQKRYAISHPEFFRLLKTKDQLSLLSEHFELHKYMSSECKSLIFSAGDSDISYYISNYIDLIIYMLKDDPNYFKFLGYTEDMTVSSKILTSLKEKNITFEDIKTLILRTSLLSSKGSLRESSSSYYPGGESVVGVDIYADEQIDLISSLSIQEMVELLKLDVNYVLPYLKVPFNGKYDESEINKFKNKAKSLFREVIKLDDYKKYDEIIDKIYDFNKDGFNLKSGLGSSLESLKLLFNKKIIENNKEEDIIKYFELLYSGKDEKDLFRKIIVNAYPKAAKILDKRENLGIYDINSLEIFEDVIIDNFKEEFINDLISYNIRDMQKFLCIVRNPEDLELFKTYYELLSNVMGENIDTIQKCISEYFVNKNLLKVIKNESLTEEDMRNAIICLNSEKNLYDINSLDDLKAFDIISREKMLEEIESAKEEKDIFKIKSIICKHILGIPYYSKSNVSYGECLNDILKIYDLNNSYGYLTESESKLMEIIEFIESISDYDKIEKLAYNLASAKNIRDPQTLYRAINKIKTNEIKKLNDRLLTTDKLDKLCAREAEKGTDLARKVEIDGEVPVYFFEGIDLEEEGIAFIYHSMNMAEGRDFMSYEGQGSMSTVSTRLGSKMDELVGSYQRKLLIFSEVGSDEMLTYSNHDANVSHAPKVIRSTFSNYGKTPFDKNTQPYHNELAFYRRVRNHNNRGSDTSGRIKPSFICIIDSADSPASLSDVDEKTYEYANKYKIPIIVIKKEAYHKKKYESESEQTNARK